MAKNSMEEVKSQEHAVVAVENEEQATEEKEKKEENAMLVVKSKGHAAAEEKNEENAMVVLENGDHVAEEEANKEESALEGKKERENAIEKLERNEKNAKEGGGEEEKGDEDGEEEKEENNAGAIEGGDKDDKDMTKEQNKENIEAASKEKLKKSRKRRRGKKVAQKGSERVTVDVKDKPESSGKKNSKKAESMGMIFMCSSNTKKDCYRYKVLGLPANKKEIVEKVYKGMRLFLFDFDLRLLYGIYKAAGPGGYNIEPKAFKSAFPAQVRFKVLEDCLPLPEEKFKRVIKDNYYTRSKFDCQLKSEQVKKLCKLFAAASRGPKSKELGISLRTETRERIRHGVLDGENRRFTDRGRVRRRGVNQQTGTLVDRDRIRRQRMDEDSHIYADLDRERHRVVDDGRHFALVGGPRYPERPVIYEREAFLSSVASLPRGPSLLPAPAPSYAYERTLEMDAYGRDPLVEHREVRVIDPEPRRRDEISSRDPYVLYREPALHHDLVYSTGLPPEYHPPGGLPSEPRHVRLPAEYRLGGSVPEYRLLRPYQYFD